MFINFWIFYSFYLFFVTFFLWLCIKNSNYLKFSRGYAYSRGCVYCFCQMFMGLRLFKGLKVYSGLYSTFFTYIFSQKNWELYNSTGLINFFQQWPQNSDLKSLRIARIHYFRRPLILYLQHRSYPSSQRPQQPHRVVDMTQDMTQVSKYSSSCKLCLFCDSGLSERS